MPQDAHRMTQKLGLLDLKGPETMGQEREGLGGVFLLIKTACC